MIKEEGTLGVPDKNNEKLCQSAGITHTVYITTTATVIVAQPPSTAASGSNKDTVSTTTTTLSKRTSILLVHLKDLPTS